MKRIIGMVLLCVMVTLMLTACGSSGKCRTCNGSGYYQKKTCPFCNGSGNSDYDPYDHYKDFMS